MPDRFCFFGGFGSLSMPFFNRELSRIHSLSFSFAFAIPRFSHFTKNATSDPGGSPDEEQSTLGTDRCPIMPFWLP